MLSMSDVFLEVMRQKVFQQQKGELFREIHDMGEYWLVSELPKYLVNPLK